MLMRRLMGYLRPYRLAVARRVRRHRRRLGAAAGPALPDEGGDRPLHRARATWPGCDRVALLLPRQSCSGRFVLEFVQTYVAAAHRAAHHVRPAARRSTGTSSACDVALLTTATRSAG
ncbi:MAG: hypothetical protein M0C28_18155 [Candidatus Moduliflexus flocculans]|nr:hypothetical protein [Candidatus Moduliflexus flocculans]